MRPLRELQQYSGVHQRMRALPTWLFMEVSRIPPPFSRAASTSPPTPRHARNAKPHATMASLGVDEGACHFAEMAPLTSSLARLVTLGRTFETKAYAAWARPDVCACRLGCVAVKAGVHPAQARFTLAHDIENSETMGFWISVDLRGV
uniref:Uncharacterized protein n=1 Tax=Calcidiscus leptoporus TaxID=127549 RepID=A0A6U5D4Y6_9EUKA|mmetsp:Transcript_11932/g.27624  ORF Transcript_11932/g.27624 Transcript_11932/m.27624 type:complete len:148 (+) Transcript_11932:321-764(+)